MGSDFGLRGLGGTKVIKAMVLDLVAAGTVNDVDDLGTNPETQDIDILEAITYISHAANAAGVTLDIGEDDGGDVTDDTIFDALDDGAAIIQATGHAGTHSMGTIGAPITLAEGYHIVQKTETDAGTGLVGKLVIIYAVDVGKGAGEVA